MGTRSLLGGEAFSQVIFFEDKRAFDEFTGGQHDATTVGKYYKGMAVYTVAKGGLMYEASIGGQKFSYKPR